MPTLEFNPEIDPKDSLTYGHPGKHVHRWPKYIILDSSDGDTFTAVRIEQDDCDYNGVICRYYTVKFNGKGANKVSKTITLTTNTEKGREQVRISAFVIPDPNAAPVVKPTTNQ